MIRFNIPFRVWVSLAFFVGFCVLLLAYCDARRVVAGLEDQAIIDTARGKSAAEAIDAVADNAFINAQTREEAAHAQDAIRKADPADRDAVARRELCKLQGEYAC